MNEKTRASSENKLADLTERDQARAQGLNDSIWDSRSLFLAGYAAEPKQEPQGERFPEFRPERTSWFEARRAVVDGDEVGTAAHGDADGRNGCVGDSRQSATTLGGVARAARRPQRAALDEGHAIDAAEGRSAAELVSPLIEQFAAAVAREMSSHVRAQLVDAVGGQSSAETLLRAVASQQRSPQQRQRHERHHQHSQPSSAPPEPRFDEEPGLLSPPARSEARASPVLPAPAGYARQTRRRSNNPPACGHAQAPQADATLESIAAAVHAMGHSLSHALSRLSTLEGRQASLQGKMAKLDSQWGGDASQMSLAIGELQSVVASRNSSAGELSSCRGQLIALAHSIDTLDKRTTLVEATVATDVTAPAG